MTTVAIIPARYASSRFPGKPLALIHDKPMIQWVWERARNCPALDETVIATDDERIRRTAMEMGAQVVITRSDLGSGTDRVAEAARLLSLADDDEIVNIQGDEPMVEAAMIDALIRGFRRQPPVDMGTLAVEAKDPDEFLNPNVVKVVVDRRDRALYFSRAPIPHRRDRGEGATPFLKHLGFYIYRCSFLQHFTRLEPGRMERVEKLEQLRALENGHIIRVALSPADTFGIDTPQDLERLQAAGALKR